MSRINTNVSSLIAQRILGQQNHGLNKSLERLSTGLQINRGADNPAGLIASERLRSEKAAITAAIGNAERADQVVNIAEGGLQEINTLLLEVQSLVGQSANDAGLSREEREANQLQIDSILQTIDRIAQATSFQGIKLLNGTFDFNVANQDSRVENFAVNAAKLETGDTRDISVVITASAQHGALFMSAGGGALDLTSNDSTFVFEVAGSKGSRQFTFASGTTLNEVATGINTFKSVTGVSAVVSGTGLVLKSTEYGSREFVSVKIVNDGGQAGSIYRMEGDDANTADTTTGVGYSTATNAIRDEGQDVGAIINGINATSTGKVARINTDFLDVEIELSSAAAEQLESFNAFTITGGGAKFNLGPAVNITNQVSIGIENVAARNLGRHVSGGETFKLHDLGSGRSLNVVDGNLENAQLVVDNAIGQVSALRGRIGAFQKNVVGATIRSLGVALENTSAAESSIRDTDFAAETAALTRGQILVSAATNVLAIANSNPQSVLQLLG
jgi:flagellin